MDRSRYTLWYEDLERHRQPSLYYLSTEDDEAGPHLICDWNGPPANFEEFDIDIMSKLVQKKTGISDFKGPKLNHTRVENDDCDKIPLTIVPRLNSSHTILSEDDGSQFDFLTVPPIARTLLKRLMNNQTASSNSKTKSAIPVEVETYTTKQDDKAVSQKKKPCLKKKPMEAKN